MNTAAECGCRNFTNFVVLPDNNTHRLLKDHKLVDEPLLVERMEPELLVELELAVSVEHFRRRIVKVRSAMLYVLVSV